MSVQPVVQVREAESTGGEEGGKVPVMGGGGGGGAGGGGTSYQYRKVLNRQSADSLKIIHDIPRSKFSPGCLQNMCKSCNCCGSCPTCGPSCCKSDCMEDVTKARKESTYTWVMENRIEFNRPMIIAKNEMFAPCLCKFRVMDSIRTVHYDDDMYDYIEVKDTQCFLVTMCCGTPGEKISFRRAICGCPSAKKCGVEVASLNVSKGEGVKTLQIIMSARDNARAKME